MELTDKLDAQMDDVMGLLLAESNRAVKVRCLSLALLCCVSHCLCFVT